MAQNSLRSFGFF